MRLTARVGQDPYAGPQNGAEHLMYGSGQSHKRRNRRAVGGYSQGVTGLFDPCALILAASSCASGRIGDRRPVCNGSCHGRTCRDVPASPERSAAAATRGGWRVVSDRRHCCAGRPASGCGWPCKRPDLSPILRQGDRVLTSRLSLAPISWSTWHMGARGSRCMTGLCPATPVSAWFPGLTLLER